MQPEQGARLEPTCVCGGCSRVLTPVLLGGSCEHLVHFKSIPMRRAHNNQHCLIHSHDEPYLSDISFIAACACMPGLARPNRDVTPSVSTTSLLEKRSISSVRRSCTSYLATLSPEANLGQPRHNGINALGPPASQLQKSLAFWSSHFH